MVSEELPEESPTEEIIYQEPGPIFYSPDGNFAYFGPDSGGWRVQPDAWKGNYWDPGWVPYEYVWETENEITTTKRDLVAYHAGLTQLHFADNSRYSFEDYEGPTGISGDDHPFLRNESWWREWYERESGRVPRSSAAEKFAIPVKTLFGTAAVLLNVM